MSINIGLALYSVRDLMAKDFFGTLEEVAKVGYKYVELLGNTASDELRGEITPKEVKAKLDELGLTPISGHVGMGPDTNWDVVIENYVTMGCKGIVIPFGFLGTEEEVNNMANMCNTLGKKCKDNGLKFYYHNHFQEFTKVNGEYGLDLLMQRTNPEYVGVELDTYWSLRGGVNPIEEMDRLGKRLGLVHQKDLSADASPINLFEVVQGELNMNSMMNIFREGKAAKPTDIVEVGTGIMDIKSICEKASQMETVECIIVELDNIFNMPPLESITLSLNNLKKFA